MFDNAYSVSPAFEYGDYFFDSRVVFPDPDLPAIAIIVCVIFSSLFFVYKFDSMLNFF